MITSSGKFLVLTALAAVAVLLASYSSTTNVISAGQQIRTKPAVFRPSMRSSILASQRSRYMNKMRGYHCQVPCGIFDDPKTVEEVKEMCSTIRKAVDEINELSSDMSKPATFNQMTRWIMTKEEHASNIIDTISTYCLCQRVKPVGAPKSPFTEEKDFIDALKAHHSVMLAAVKSKQSTEIGDVAALEHAVADWAKMYTPL
mmetsp:Transcript_20879/g.29261  ORF Transcript_20879/g.29261 Transcript_20879/m.29261 type:complete len:202 (+) Transcript_20879:21-626(+)